MVAAGVLVVGAKGGDLDNLAAEAHMHDTEAAADDAAAAKQLPDLLRCGVGGYIEVLGVTVQQQVAHTAAHKVGVKIGLVQAFDNLQGAGTDIPARYRVLVTGDYLVRGEVPAGGPFVDKPLVEPF